MQQRYKKKLQAGESQQQVKIERSWSCNTFSEGDTVKICKAQGG